MNRKQSTAIVAGALLLVVGAPAWANDDDSTVVGLRVTVVSADPATGDVTVSVTATDDYNGPGNTFSSAYLGTAYYYDGFLESNGALPPAVDWGDGVTTATAQVPFTTILGSNLQRARGQLTHTYTAPGNFTIRVFAQNVYGGSTYVNFPLYGNSAYGGVTNTATVDLTAVPALPRRGLAMLAIVLAALGAAVLLYRRG